MEGRPLDDVLKHRVLPEQFNFYCGAYVPCDVVTESQNRRAILLSPPRIIRVAGCVVGRVNIVLDTSTLGV